ncbi:hypothetical protein BJ684DRAFT_5521, partial [Piptocephalis cylindrospora]
LDFRDPSLCPFYLSGLCPYDLFKNTRMELGTCPKIHDERTKKAYEKECEKDGPFPDLENALERELGSRVADCDRKIRVALSRLDKVAEDPASKEVSREIDDLTTEITDMTGEVERWAEGGRVDEALRALQKTEDLRNQRTQKEEQLRRMGVEGTGQVSQKLRVCEVCSAYLSILDTDARLADHFIGKLHMGYKEIRDRYEELRKRSK